MSSIGCVFFVVCVFYLMCFLWRLAEVLIPEARRERFNFGIALGFGRSRRFVYCFSLLCLVSSFGVFFFYRVGSGDDSFVPVDVLSVFGSSIFFVRCWPQVCLKSAASLPQLCLNSAATPPQLFTPTFASSFVCVFSLFLCRVLRGVFFIFQVQKLLQKLV